VQPFAGAAGSMWGVSHQASYIGSTFGCTHCFAVVLSVNLKSFATSSLLWGTSLLGSETRVCAEVIIMRQISAAKADFSISTVMRAMLALASQAGQLSWVG